MDRSIAFPGDRGVRPRAWRAGVGQTGETPLERAWLARAASALLNRGDLRAARKLLAEACSRTGGARLNWGSAWALRVSTRHSALPASGVPARLRSKPSGSTPSAVEPRAEMPEHQICIAALGEFSLTIDGVLYTSGVKPQRKPLDLLKVLLVCNGSGAGAMELADKLWPDADGDTARNSLQVAVHRLRRLLGSDQAIVVHDRKVFLDPASCWADLWAFAQEAESATRRASDDPTLPARACAALNLYRGHLFAQEAEQAWMLAPRQRLHRLWLCLIKRLGDYYEARAGWSGAAELYLQALDLDPLAEEIYRRLMRCQQKAGERTEALHTYRRCREQLIAALGVAPSGETERLYLALRSAA